MGQTSGSDKDYIYKDKSERYHYMNTFYIFAVVILWVLFVVYLLAKLVSKSIAVGTAVGNVVLIILFAVVELAFYLRNKSDVRLKSRRRICVDWNADRCRVSLFCTDFHSDIAASVL